MLNPRIPRIYIPRLITLILGAAECILHSASDRSVGCELFANRAVLGEGAANGLGCTAKGTLLCLCVMSLAQLLVRLWIARF